METKFKPKGEPDDSLKFGVYFKSENDVSTEYLVELCPGRFEQNALVKIYVTDFLGNHFDTDGLVNGEVIGISESEIEWVAEVDLCPKYFFPKFDNGMQMYYDDKKYYGREKGTDQIASLMECINYAIEYGLKESGIKPY